ncbi:aminoglycoside phosphotransferase family protein [Paenibacillus filicis]|uniref:Aminoglycoside phosphotransferase family protein n=1 Tax=Paenibacillus filicis TaxID=669464 RepID=A0ABU9DHP2_9BACL
MTKGYSSDRKYLVRKAGQSYLLRTFDSQQNTAKQMEYQALEKMKELQVRCSRPLEFGSIPALRIGYMLLTFIEGQDAAEELPGYSSQDQYRIGCEAGSELLKMHRYHAPAHIASWYDRKVSKHKRYMEAYLKLGVRIKGDELIISWIEQHLHLMKGRPNRFQHDDFHVNNLITRDKQLAGVIDFNRWDWGDPVHEFLKVGMFSADVSIPFSIGQIRGYHQGQEPDDLFWKLYSLYMAMCMISSVVWIIQVKPEETTIMMDKIDKVLDDHRYFELAKPAWYAEDGIL